MKKKNIITSFLILACLFSVYLMQANCSVDANYTHCNYWFMVKRDGTWTLVELSTQANPENTFIGTGNFTVKGNSSTPLVCPNCQHDAWSHDVDESGFTLGPLYESEE